MDAVVMGGTGLVGRALLDVLSKDMDYAGVTAIGRRVVEVPGVRCVVVEGEKLSAADVPRTARAAFCCLGTTIKAAGSQDAFRAVDHALVLRFAQAAKEAGVRGFHVVSSVGANPSSRVFYLRVKGEMERELAEVGFESASAYRPSSLLGERDAPRPGERWGIAAGRLLDPILPRKLRSIRADVVARAMARNAKAPRPGFNVYGNEEIQALSSGTS